MELNENDFIQFQNFLSFCKANKFQYDQFSHGIDSGNIDFYKRGNKIRIKKANRGKFTEYCGGKVTQECIQRGKNSPDPKIRKRATFAANARKWSKNR